MNTFIWQACNDILPTKERLFKRHITEDPLCPISGLENETIGHILWSCPSTMDVWMECVLEIHKCTTSGDDFIHIVEKLMDRLNLDQMQRMATLARLIWLRRNSVIFVGNFWAQGLFSADQRNKCKLIIMQQREGMEGK